MSETKKLSFSERVRLNDEMAALPETPYISWRDTADVVEPQLVELHPDEHLQEQETELLNRFSDSTLSDLAYQTISQQLIETIDKTIDERVAVGTPGVLNIQKGDFVRLPSGELAKVQRVVNGVVQAKRDNGEIKKIRVIELARIGKFKGRPAFGSLSLKRN